MRESRTTKQRFIKIASTIVYPPLKLYWFVFRPKTYGVKCVIQNGREILMIRNTYGPGWWTFPGGGIKRNETAEQAVKREVIEEVGISIKDLRKIGEFTSTAEYKKDTISVFVGISENNNITIDEKEILEAQWFFSNNLPAMSPYARKIIAMWLGEEI